jgi:hypothetical protein
MRSTGGSTAGTTGSWWSLKQTRLLLLLLLLCQQCCGCCGSLSSCCGSILALHCQGFSARIRAAARLLVLAGVMWGAHVTGFEGAHAPPLPLLSDVRLLLSLSCTLDCCVSSAMMPAALAIW